MSLCLYWHTKQRQAASHIRRTQIKSAVWLVHTHTVVCSFMAGHLVNDTQHSGTTRAELYVTFSGLIKQCRTTEKNTQHFRVFSLNAMNFGDRIWTWDYNWRKNVSRLSYELISCFSSQNNGRVTMCSWLKTSRLFAAHTLWLCENAFARLLWNKLVYLWEYISCDLRL